MAIPAPVSPDRGCGNHAEEGRHPARFGPSRPVGVKPMRPTTSAPPGLRHPGGRYAGCYRSLRQLPAKIETSRPAGVPSKGLQDVGSDFIARFADRGSQEYGQIARINREAPLQHREPHFQYAGGGPPPTRMQNGDAAAGRVGNEHRNAVRGRDRQQHSSLRSHKTIYRVDDQRTSESRRLRLYHAGTVHLSADD